MTKVSMRHLNEIVRERNQYSRDALEAWQDFINLKGRMDTELSKVSKRNNYLIEELESWKQQVSGHGLGQCAPTFADEKRSSSNSKPLPTHSPRRPRTSRSRSRATSARTAVWLVSSTNRRTTPPGCRFASLARRSSVTTPLRPLSCSRRSPRSWSGSARGTGRN